jgi:formylglycine-generating enzyme required for sulfatase activity
VLLATLDGSHTDDVGLVFSPDGLTLASSSSGPIDGSVKLWDLRYYLRKASRLKVTDSGVATQARSPSLTEMATIPAGNYAMGDTFGEGLPYESPVHTVYVSAFAIDKCEVTRSLWDEVAGWGADHGYDIGPGDVDGSAVDHPVWNVSWHEALKWANARSEMEGLTPCYAVNGNVYSAGKHTPDCNWSANGYRLPTEAEWEKAARGGEAGHRFPWSDTDTIQHARANYLAGPTSYGATYGYDTSPTQGQHPSYSNTAENHTSPVGSFAPNGYGLYDTAGNVWEWCWDWISDSYYASSSSSDPRGPEAGSSRVIRGGCSGCAAFWCRASSRTSGLPDFDGSKLGFRLVRTAQ